LSLLPALTHGASLRVQKLVRSPSPSPSPFVFFPPLLSSVSLVQSHFAVLALFFFFVICLHPPTVHFKETKAPRTVRADPAYRCTNTENTDLALNAKSNNEINNNNNKGSSSALFIRRSSPSDACMKQETRGGTE
jgi:hypothetical protein